MSKSKTTDTPIDTPTVSRIYSAWAKEGRAETPRTYLGASLVGHACDAYVWYLFRGAVRECFDGRMYRLFDRGKREEDVFVADLKRVGCDVRPFDETGRQFAVTALGGHFGGHLDGLVCGLVEAPKTWHVAEFKTHSDDSFRKLRKEGVAKAKPQHLAQMTVYMGLVGLTDAFYLAVNKDTDELYGERVKFDKTLFDDVLARARRIIAASEPERCANRPDDYRCKACPCASVCWHADEHLVDPSIPKTCRTCCHATADTEQDGAVWTCRLGHMCGANRTCDKHLVLPCFVRGEPTDGDNGKIVYAVADANGGTQTISVGPCGDVTMDEAQKVVGSDIASVVSIKDALPGATVVRDNAIALKYQSDRYESFMFGTRQELCDNLSQIGCDGSKPIRTQNDADGTCWFEYVDDVCVRRSADRATFTLFVERMPF